MGIKLSVYSPERKLLTDLDVTDVTLTGSEGEIQILSGHANMVGTLETGPFRYRVKDAEAFEGVISTGFFEVFNDQVSVIGETLELSNEIDVERAKRAEIAAQEKLRDASLSPEEIEKYRRKVERARARLNLKED